MDSDARRAQAQSSACRNGYLGPKFPDNGKVRKQQLKMKDEQIPAHTVAIPIAAPPSAQGSRLSTPMAHQHLPVMKWRSFLNPYAAGRITRVG